MNLSDYHTHNYFCNHAEGYLDDYIRAAIALQLQEIGLSDHFPMDVLPEEFHVYAMSMDSFPVYIAKAIELRDKYQDKITVRIASEVDYHPDYFEGYKRLVTPFLDTLDYLIGSIHAVSVNGHMVPVDAQEAVPVIKELGVDDVYLEYYGSLLKLVKTGFYHVIGHFDVPKKYGLIPENGGEVQDSILRILDEVERMGMAVEINTSGLRKEAKEQYPSDKIIKELINRDIPITLGSDAHHPQEVGFAFVETVKKLKEWGLKSLCHYSSGEQSFHPLTG